MPAEEEGTDGTAPPAETFGSSVDQSWPEAGASSSKTDNQTTADIDEAHVPRPSDNTSTTAAKTAATDASPTSPASSSSNQRLSHDVSAKDGRALLSPGPRRPKPPTKGILKPPPPPAKPTLTNRLRDIVTVVGGGAKSLFDPMEETTPGAGPSTPPPSVGGTLNAISGRLQMGLSRFVSPQSQPPATPTHTSSPLRSATLPEAVERTPAKEKQPLRRATFLLPCMSITYPISSQGEPWSQKVLEDRQKIESTHKTLLTTTTGAQYWTAGRLVALYESACRGREERPRLGIIRALEILPDAPRPRSIHIILRPSDSTAIPATPHMLDAPLNRHAAEAFADVLTAEWGLAELKLESGVIDGDDSLKPILHALLISGTLPTLSVAGNKRIKAGGWRYLAVFLKRARSLRFVDLSDTIWDRKGIEYLVQALNCTQVRPAPAPDPKDTPESPEQGETVGEGSTSRRTSREEGRESFQDETSESSTTKTSLVPPAPLLKDARGETKPSAVQSVRMDGCGLRTAALEALAQGIRSSDLKHLSLRRNRIGPLGAVALAVMIRDYPDNPSSMSSLHHTQLHSLQSRMSDLERPPSPVPYTPRRRPGTNEEEAPLPPIPLVVSSPAGGVTSRTIPEGYKPPVPPKHPLVMPGGGNSAMQDMHSGSFAVNQTQVEGKVSAPESGGASVALQRSVRALDGIERIGRLVTLDLKSNEIKNGVGYVAQVLKRNRTLKVLNLADNRMDGAGLALLAEALKYNSTLETLDLSNNPCCGPGSEGIAALRTAFTVNTSLKRLFLADTGLHTEGAISLAEFLPESKSLLHLDLTSNPAIDTAGILAISVGLKANHLIRCLDISIPPNNPELAELSQNILQACIRNTELAASAMTSKEGKAEGVWAPIKKSNLVKSVKQAEEARAEKERVDQVTSPEGQARVYVYTLKPEKVPVVAESTILACEKWFNAAAVAKRTRGNVVWEPGQLPKDDWAPLLQRAKVLRERLEEVIGETTDADQLEQLLALNDGLSSVIDRSKGFTPPPRILLPSQIVQQTANAPETPTGARGPSGPGGTKYPGRRHMRIHSLEISSPNFSIGDSDNDSDAEELDVHSLANQRGIHEELHGLGIGSTPTRAGGSNRDVEELIALENERNGQHSPVEKASKAWVEEEGEIFRKGTKLGVVDDEDDEQVSGEQLRQEILDTPVARSPVRRRMSADEADGERPAVPAEEASPTD